MKKTVPFLLLTAMLPLGASALSLSPLPNTFDYDYLDAGFVNYDTGGNGIYLRGAIDVYPNFNLFSGFSAADDYIEFHAGIGYHQAVPALKNTDMLFTFGIERGEFDVGGGTLDDADTGAFLSAGLRASATPALELYTDINYHSFYSGDFTVDLGLRLQMNDKLDLTLGGVFGDNDTLEIGVRYYY